jgi:hypothetical protein
MRWLLLAIGVAGLLWTRRQFARLHRLRYHDVNADSARRRLEALSRSDEWMR